jgi:predicted ATP-dependent serine protease
MEHGFAPIEQTPIGTLATEQSQTAAIEYAHAPAWSSIWPQGVPRGIVQLWTGRPGHGKSRLALHMATDIGVTAYLSLEMSEAVLLDTAKSCGSELSRLWPYYSPGALLSDLPIVQPAVIVVDSLQELGSKRTLAQLFGWCRVTPGVLILVSQVNSDGQARGGNAVPHGVDAVFDVQGVPPAPYVRARVKARKNRCTLSAVDAVFSLGN